MKRTTLFLDQGETLGGSERFLLDFFESLSGTEIRRVNPVLAGGKITAYTKRIPNGIVHKPFLYPSVRGGLFRKICVLGKLFSAAVKLKKLAKEVGATQIFSNTPRTHFVTYIAKKFLRMKGRWVFLLHDFTIPRRLLRSIAKKSDVVIVNSLACREYARMHIRTKDYKKIHIVENGFDFPHIPKPTPPTQIQTVSILGRIDPLKGQLYALEAADLLQERNADLKFQIIGSPFALDPRTIEYEQQLHKFVQDRDLKNVHFIDEVDDPFDAIKKTDLLLVLPTEPETFGRVTVEALALGKIVLAFNQTGPREILTQYEQFLLKKWGRSLPISLKVEPENAMSLAETIGFFADNPPILPLYTKYARTFAEKAYPLTETKKRLFNILIQS